MRYAAALLPLVLAYVGASSYAIAQDESSSNSPASQSALQIEIQSPSDDFTAVQGETVVEVEGIASAIGGVSALLNASFRL